VTTKIKRIALTPDAKLDAALAKLSVLQRRPKAAIAAELLAEMTPALERIAGLLEVAMRDRASLPASAAHKLAALEDLMAHTATFGLDRLEEAVAPASGKRAARAVRKPRVRRH
jgi:hypothetical protein